MSRSGKPAVSVIIPVYNCEKYIQRCLDSVYDQTFLDYEIIIIDDGSTDSSYKILKKNARQHKNIRLSKQANHGQGYTRNIAIHKAQGEYILFIDADDYIDKETIARTIKLAKKNNADLVHFDWQALSSTPDEQPNLHHFNTEVFVGKKELQGDDCEELLQMNNFFSVNNLYLTSFLRKNKIRYDEGHIYEDATFMVRVASAAKSVAIIDDPLYVMQVNPNSSTRSMTKTDRHYKESLIAVRKSFRALIPRRESARYFLAAYFLEKFVIYYEKRVPMRFRWVYLKDFVDIIHRENIDLPSKCGSRKFLNFCINHSIFRKKRYVLFRILVWYKVYIAQHIAKAISHK